MPHKNHSDTNLTIHPIEQRDNAQIPFYISYIQAGFPSPADDYIADPIDLNRELILHPVATFMGRVRGDSMINAGIYNGDLLIIDKSLTPKTGDVAVCFIDGEFTIKYIKISNNNVLLIPANPEFPTITVNENNEFMIWGIVTYSVHRHRNLGNT